MKNIEPQKLVRMILESIEVSAACPDCGNLSIEVMLGAGDCPHCEAAD